MKCPRCSGVMSYEKFHGSHESFFGWRCINCGDIVDQVILENRIWKNQLSRYVCSIMRCENDRLIFIPIIYVHSFSTKLYVPCSQGGFFPMRPRNPENDFSL